MRYSAWSFLAILVASSLFGCVSFWGAGFDERPIVVQTFSLFNQRLDPSGDAPQWRGDWIFRRERLGHFDFELRISKPDLIIFQEFLIRAGSPTESDEAILGAGALSGYRFTKQKVGEYQDTRENEYLSVAVSLPLKLSDETLFRGRREWTLGDKGRVTVSLVESDGQDISVFNVVLPSSDYIWYQKLDEIIVSHLRYGGYCPKRVIVSGYLPPQRSGLIGSSSPGLLALKDVVEDGCEALEKCNTLSESNTIYMKTMNGESSGRVDRILVHEETLVYSSRRLFDRGHPVSEYLSKYGLDSISESRRYGWGAEIRLPKCSDSDFLQGSE